MLAPFIIMPLILDKVGADLFGLWVTILSFTAMAMFVDFGIGNGLLTKLSYEQGLNNYESMRVYITSAYVVLGSICLFLITLMLVVLYFLNLEYGSYGIVLVSMTTFILSIPISIIQKVMYAKQMIISFNLWQIVGSLTSIILCYIFIYLKLENWIVILGYSLPPLFILIVLSFIFFYNNREISPHINCFSKKKAKNLLQIGSKFLILSIFTAIALNADNIILNITLGSEMVTEYSVPAKLASILGLVIGVLFMPLWASNGQALAKKDYSWVLIVTKKMSVLGFFIVSFFSVLLIYFNQEIFQIWMNRQFISQRETLINFCLLSCVMAIASPWFMLLNSLNVINLQIKVWAIYTVLSIILKFTLITDNNIWILSFISFILYSIVVAPLCIYIAYKKIKELKLSTLVDHN
ncbi:oligosaccharide flippase family protein [Acinetobacter towneri]|nr:oligosaccharide flippase family protein [Acinetobacter towneri]